MTNPTYDFTDQVAVVTGAASIGRLGHADEVAAAAVWLCSPAASFVVGAILPVDGGYTTH